MMFEKHFPSTISEGDFFGEAGTASAVKLDVSLFSFEFTATSRLSRDERVVDECVVVDDDDVADVDSSDESASAIFSRSFGVLLSQSYMCIREKKSVN
jgi:hypothetical protein